MTDRSEWPEWLQDAHTENAQVEIIAGVVHWHGGSWHDGTWHGGSWLGGTWYRGSWLGGTWHRGEWHNGIWLGGTWHNGIWHGGDWRGGAWRGGVWHGGAWYRGTWHDGVWLGGSWHDGVWHSGVWRGGQHNTYRCMFRVAGSVNTINVGCQQYTIEQAQALCDGGELPDEAPDRNSEAGRLLRASVLAQIAFQKALLED